MPRKFFGEIVSGYLIRRWKTYIAFPLLDAGAGNGAMIRELRARFPARLSGIVGIDLNRENAELNIRRADVRDLPFDDASFVTIICSEVLEHLEDETLAGAFSEFRRTLAPEGHLLCTVPYAEDLESKTVQCPKCDHRFHYVGHVRSFSSQSRLREIFREGGFSVVHQQILPLGAVAKFPPLRLLAPWLNKLDNPPGLVKRAILVARHRSQPEEACGPASLRH